MSSCCSFSIPQSCRILQWNPGPGSVLSLDSIEISRSGRPSSIACRKVPGYVEFMCVMIISGHAAQRTFELVKFLGGGCDY